MNANPLLDLDRVSAVLCDADGTLFPSEAPPYAASAVVTRAFAEHYRLDGDFSPAQLMRTGIGRNFRSLSRDLLAAAEIQADPEDLNRWIARERVAVTAHLAEVLRPRGDVRRVTEHLSRRYQRAVVSASASPRLLACLRATGLDRTFPPQVVFSAEDSMAHPVGKPDPAIYRHALQALDLDAAGAIAVEDSATGVRSAVGAGIRVIGLVQFVPTDERERRVAELHEAGASAMVRTWTQLSDVLLSGPLAGGGAGETADEETTTETPSQATTG
jgi:HAD superfamily hydrolase (TIGR01509 family)